VPHDPAPITATLIERPSVIAITPLRA